NSQGRGNICALCIRHFIKFAIAITLSNMPRILRFATPIFNLTRWPSALAIASATTAAGVACFVVLDHLEPIGELDYWFYAAIYSSIGAITGLAAWYCARLTGVGHATPAGIALALAAPYAFVLFLALDKNPFIAVLATPAFVLILLCSWLSHRNRHQPNDGDPLLNESSPS
ncbi:MAG: hypothetical protein AB7G28_25540, partial [Pirellulales bacterium]